MQKTKSTTFQKNGMPQVEHFEHTSSEEIKAVGIEV